MRKGGGKSPPRRKELGLEKRFLKKKTGRVSKTQWMRPGQKEPERDHIRGTSYRENDKIQSLRDGDPRVGTVTHAEKELKV